MGLCAAWRPAAWRRPCRSEPSSSHCRQRERDGEAERLASQERVQQRPHPERCSARFGEQNEFVEVTKNSSKNQILQRIGDQILKGFAQDRVQQLLVEQSFVPCGQSGVIEATMISSQDQSWQRTVEQILDDARHEPGSRISERLREQKGVLYLLEKTKERKREILRFSLQFEHCVSSSE